MLALSIVEIACATAVWCGQIAVTDAGEATPRLGCVNARRRIDASDRLAVTELIGSGLGISSCSLPWPCLREPRG
jgi:hypothetical protein